MTELNQFNSQRPSSEQGDTDRKNESETTKPSVTVFRRFKFSKRETTQQEFTQHAVLQRGASFSGPLASAVPKGVVMTNRNEKMGMKMNAAPTAYLPETQFDTEVLRSKQPVLAVFETPWSRPCRVLDPVVQELANDWAGSVKVVRVNADDSLDLSLYYNIQSIPTLLFFAAGKLRLKVVGTATKDAIITKLKASGFADHVDAFLKDASGAGAVTSKGGLI